MNHSTQYPSPDILSFCVEDSFVPPLPAMRLKWNQNGECKRARRWRMPLGTILAGPPPTRFGILIQRHAVERYALFLVWDRAALTWPDLTRGEIANSSLSQVLECMGTRLEDLLDQPVADLEERIRWPERALHTEVAS